MTKDAKLRVRDLHHSYGNGEVLQHIDLDVAAHEVHCLLGPSGTGKSTLLRVIAGLEPLQRGSVEIEGVSVGHVPPELRSVGFVFQDYALFPHLNVRRNVLFGIAGEPGAEERVQELLAQVGLEELVDVMPHTLSGGEQQRVALARALARRPSIMLLDEPFSSLDAQLRGAVRERTLSALREVGVATLVVTHDPAEAMAIADSISVLLNGKIAQTGTPQELYERPRSLQVGEVFGPMNVLAGPEGEQLARPEHLELRRDAVDGSRPATVQSVAIDGGMANVRLELEGERTLEARVYARDGWKAGDVAHVRLISTLRTVGGASGVSLTQFSSER